MIFSKSCCGLEPRAAFKRCRLRLFCPDPAKLSCYLEAEVYNVEDEEEILLDDIDDLLSGHHCCLLKF